MKIEKMSFFGIAFLFLFLISCTSVDVDKELSSQMKLGFCRTMEVYARAYARVNNLEPVFLGTTSEVLEQLRHGNIDVAIVGRKAWSNEVNQNIIEKQLQPGYTLIAKEQILIQEYELSNYMVHTYVESDIAEVLLPDLNIIYHETLEIALFYAMEGYPNAALIDWSDYVVDLPLLIPMSGDDKLPEFRTPFFYARDNILKSENI